LFNIWRQVSVDSIVINAQASEFRSIRKRAVERE